MSSPQSTTVRCPQCQQPVNTTMYSIVDVGKQPQLKQALLRGQLNGINCPHCGYRGMVAMPMLYHDPAKQLALVMMPMELGLKREGEERAIGKLTNALIDSLPPEQRKMYMLQPRMVLSYQRLSEEILQADGITKEMLDKQAAQIRLLETLLQSGANPDDFKRVVQEHKDELNQEFITFITALARSTETEDNDAQASAQLMQLAAALASELGLQAPAGLTVSVDEIIDELQQAKNDDELKEIVAAIRPVLDYKFYQALTAKLDAAPPAEAQALKKLRERLLKMSDELDRETESTLRRASQLLQQVLRSDDPVQWVADHIEQIDEAFLMVVQANIQQASQQNQPQIAQALQGIYDETVAQLESRMPPEMKLINRLLRATPGERAEILRESAAEITPQLMQTMTHLAGDLQAQGRAEVANELRGVINQAAAWARPVAQGR